jgi:hypothetical protein
MRLLKPGKRRRRKPFTTVAVVLLALMVLVNLSRLFYGWEVTVNGTVVPKWVSWPALGVSAWVALMLWREARK